MSINEKITNFIGNNLEKVSKNKYLTQVNQPIKSFEPSEEFIKHSTTSFKYIFVIFIIILLIIIAWYYIKKYYPEWKQKISQDYNKFKTSIYNFFHPQPIPTETPIKTQTQKKDLLTKAQITNFNQKEKETTEPQPDTQKQTYTENIFDSSDNLNSNKILDYLLEEENGGEWCFIGESNGDRYCSISQGNLCMSGNVFPTKDLCINPKIRSV